MPAGLPYFAWIDVGETAFGPEHLRWDEAVFSFTLAQEEGDPATLTAVIRRPANEEGGRIGLLGPGRKIWAWFALDCGPALIKFRGRLVGIPTSLFEDLVTLEFVAKPTDLVVQKEALADTLRVLPFYDEAVIDKARRDDSDVVLEGYTKIWHYDRETHVITVSDEISGEDGLVNFMCVDGDILYDGLGLTLATGPLARVDIAADFTWTQQARGTVDLTQYLYSHWPDARGGEIPSMTAADWPKHGSGLGDGWEVADSTAQDQANFSTHTTTKGGTLILEAGGGGITMPGTSRMQWSSSITAVADTTHMFPGVISSTVTTNSYSVTHDLDQDGNLSASSSRSYATNSILLGIQGIKATLVAGYSAERQLTEHVALTLFADVQSILTDPEDGEALRINDIRSVNLSGEKKTGEFGTDEELPPIIDDPRRRSYIATERGNQSIEHLIALARAHLMKRARAVEITFAPKLPRMPEVTLRKNAFLVEPRIGEALGKIIGYSIALDGSDGRVNCQVRIGCTVGRGGIVTATAGTPTYCSIDYAGADYQRFVERTVLVDAFADSSVGYQPPQADPNDDGIDFLSALRAEDVIEVDLVVERGEAAEEQKSPTNTGREPPASAEEVGDTLEAQTAWANQQMVKQYQTLAKFKLKSMTKEFSTNYDLQVTELKIPTGYDLEAV